MYGIFVRGPKTIVPFKALKKKHALFCTKKHKLMRNNSIEKIISRCIIMLTKKYGGI